MASPCPVSSTSGLRWFWMTSAFETTCCSRTGLCLSKLPVARSTLFCRLCSFKRSVSAAYSQTVQAKPLLTWFYLSIFIHSCCSHLEHSASVKRFVSLQFVILSYSVTLLGRGISPTQGRYLHRATQIQNKRRQTSMPWVGFESTIPVFERTKTVHACLGPRGHCDRHWPD
jgi:hypothetical protein